MKERNKRNRSSSVWWLTLLLLGCGGSVADHPAGVPDVRRRLPFIGEHDVVFVKAADGAMVADTQYYQVPKFSFINQNRRSISHRDVSGKVVVADFFFSHCKTICPILSSQVDRLQKRVNSGEAKQSVVFLSHTVDPIRDTPEVLKTYADQIGADTSNWHFLTGSQEDLYWQAEEGYKMTAFPSDTADGGFFHTDDVVLLDDARHIRGIYEGTSTKAMDQLYEDIQVLILEINERNATTPAQEKR
jgi:protein SCO1